MSVKSDSNHERMKHLIKSISGQENVIAIPRLYISLTGDIKAALILTQLVYWSDKGWARQTGYTCKSYAEWEDETSLTKKEVSGAIKKLTRWVNVKVKRAKQPNGSIAPTCHYKVDLDKLTEDILNTGPIEHDKRYKMGRRNFSKSNQMSQSESDNSAHFESNKRALSESDKRAHSLTETIQREQPKNSSSRVEPSANSAISSIPIDSPTTATIYDPTFDERDELIGSLGIGDPVRTQLLNDPFLTLEYLRVKAPTMRAAGKTRGLAVNILRQHEPLTPAEERIAMYGDAYTEASEAPQGGAFSMLEQYQRERENARRNPEPEHAFQPPRSGAFRDVGKPRIR